MLLRAGGAQAACLDSEQFFDLLRSFKEQVPSLTAEASDALRRGTHVRQPSEVSGSALRLGATFHLRHHVWSHMADRVNLPQVTAESLDLQFKRHLETANAAWHAVLQQTCETSSATQARRAAGKPDVTMSDNEELVIFYETEFGVVCHLELYESIRKQVEATAQPPIAKVAAVRRHRLAVASGSRRWSFPEAATDSSPDSSADSEDGECMSPRSSTVDPGRGPCQTSGSMVQIARAAHSSAGQPSIGEARLARRREKKRAREEERLRQLEGLRSKRPNTALPASPIGSDHEPRVCDPRQQAVERAANGDVFSAISVLDVFKALHPDGCALRGVALTDMAKALLMYLSADKRMRLGWFLIPPPDAQGAVLTRRPLSPTDAHAVYDQYRSSLELFASLSPTAKAVLDWMVARSTLTSVSPHTSMQSFGAAVGAGPEVAAAAPSPGPGAAPSMPSHPRTD